MPPRPFRALTAFTLISLISAAAAQDAAPLPGPRATTEPAPDDLTVTELAAASEIIVTATRTDRGAADLPYATSVVGRDGAQGIETRLRRTVTDAMADLPSVMVQKTSYGQASPFIRGFTGYRTVMLVDGIRLNNSTYRSGPNQYWATIDPFAVERIELVRGPGSVLHGSDAVGGVANAVARRRGAFDAGTHVEYRTFVRYADAEDSWTVRGESQGNVGELGFLVGGTYRSFSDLEAGSGTNTVHDSGYRDSDGDLRLDYHHGDRTVWTFGVQHVDQDHVPRTHKTVYAKSFRGTDVGEELRRDLSQTRDLIYGRLRHDVDGTIADAYEVTLSYHRQRESQHRDRDATRTDKQGVDVGTWGVQAQFDKSTDWGELTYGVEWWRDDVDSYRKDYDKGVLVLDRVQGPVADDARYDLVGVYAQDEVMWGATTFIGGARWTYAKARASDVDNPAVGGADPDTPGNTIRVHDSWDKVVGSLRAIHPLSEEWSAFGGVSQAFRAPNLSDLTRLDATSGVETPSPGLDSEEYLTYEAGVRHDSAEWSFQAAYWYTDIDDQIVASPTGRSIGGTPEVRKDNIGDGWVNGVEVEGRWRASAEWTVDGAISWMDGEVDQLDPSLGKVSRPISRLMPLTATATVGYSPLGEPWSVWASVRKADEQDQLSLKDETDTTRIPEGGTPGYAVYSVGGRYRFTDDIEAILAIENLTDRDYRIHGSGVNEPGLNAILAVDIRF